MEQEELTWCEICGGRYAPEREGRCPWCYPTAEAVAGQTGDFIRAQAAILLFRRRGAA